MGFDVSVGISMALTIFVLQDNIILDEIIVACFQFVCLSPFYHVSINKAFKVRRPVFAKEKSITDNRRFKM